MGVIFWSVSFYVTVLLSVAYLTLFERKILAASQGRKGPEMVGWYGILQPFADGIKLFSKEYFTPSDSNPVLFFLGPCFMLFHSFVLWGCSPGVWGCGVHFFWGALYVLSVMSVGVYGVVLCGWSSNSKYAMFGAVRALAQVISYEVMLVMLYVIPFFMSRSLNLSDVLFSQWSGCNGFVLPLAFPWWMFCVLAETNRAPFDFVEGESELVSGFNVEFGSGGFAMIFIAEYASVIFMGQLTSVLFLSGLSTFRWGCYWEFIGTSIFSPLMGFLVVLLVVLCRSSFPRYRYDLLMNLVWRRILPVLMGSFSCFLLLL
ncbi:NADH dehydrogenase subunit 1 (mitochondrion) [Mizuhopecten yessoensis]|uniref:NADH-ubiquinone oxidoreductase chain 1 n=1 Tax=Mizuhopecten yessoensis TaxID=6573 RepID=C4NTN2_MIZYE|nr:NADH dehydrogenase subunit 1 [Mizuhopecten yessoensis]ACL36048.1 NADH dehydrogenase subunit 1 [Mizuhopecten yessoensis]